MGYSAETNAPSSSCVVCSIKYSNVESVNKNGLVRYFLNNKQVTETQYIETFADTIANDGSGYTGDMHIHN